MFSGAVSRWVIVGVSVTLWWVLLLLEFHPYPTRAYYKNFAAYLSGLEDASAYFDSFDAKTRDTYRAAYFLKTHTTPDERVFIWGNEPMIYSLADRSPVGKFIVDFHIESVNAYDETMEVLMGYKPKYILDSVHEVNSFPELYNFLGEEYTEYQTYGRVTVYRQGLVQD